MKVEKIGRDLLEIHMDQFLAFLLKLANLLFWGSEDEAGPPREHPLF